jgi:hypothetical protein
MKIADDDRENIALLLETGNKLGAVRYIQQTFSMTAEEAIGLAEKLDSQPPAKDLSYDRRSSYSRLTAVILSVTGFVMLSLGFVFGFRDYSFTSNAVLLAGRVVEVRAVMAGDMKLYAPVIEYAWMGKPLLFEGPAKENPILVNGDKIELFIDPGKPLEPRLNSFFERWFVIVMLATFGLAFSVIGFFVRKWMT